MPETHRFWGTVSQEKYDQIEKWSAELGIPVYAFAAMAVWIGAKKIAEMHNLGTKEAWRDRVGLDVAELDRLMQEKLG